MSTLHTFVLILLFISYGNAIERQATPHFTLISPKRIDVMPGSDVNITCEATGSPMPVVQWYLGQTEISNTTPIGENVLLLKNVSSSANYTCTAGSTLGYIQANVTVKIKALPKTPTNLQLARISSTLVVLAWNSGNTEPVTSYNVWYTEHKRSGGEVDNDYTVVHNVYDTELTVDDLNSEKSYEFKVQATNDVGMSRVSESVYINMSASDETTTPTIEDISSASIPKLLRYIESRWCERIIDDLDYLANSDKLLIAFSEYERKQLINTTGGVYLTKFRARRAARLLLSVRGVLQDEYISMVDILLPKYTCTIAQVSQQIAGTAEALMQIERDLMAMLNLLNNKIVDTYKLKHTLGYYFASSRRRNRNGVPALVRCLT